MPSRTLSKSDFILGSDCPTKLYYKKCGYPNTKSDDGYLSFLAEGGYLIGAVSKLYFPGGIDIYSEARGLNLDYQQMNDAALRRTKELMNQDCVVLFEPAFLIGKRLVRVDVLVKDGSQVELIEVKSKTQNGRDPEWKESKWGKYFDDLAFQLIAVRNSLPTCQVVPFLMSPDKSYVAEIDNLTSCFQLSEAETVNNFRNVDVQFRGDDALAQQIRDSHLLRKWEVQEHIENRLSDVELRAADFEAWLGDETLNHPRSPLTKNCFGCEYDLGDSSQPSGFLECWQSLGTAERHIKTLYRVGSLGGGRNPTANRWIEEGRVGHDDIQPNELTGACGERILIQIENTRNGTEWINREAIATELSQWTYPLHFIDFETSSSPLPHHTGMRPYETIPFQWSCHTIAESGANPTHCDFLNTEALYPGLEFLESLRAAIGTSGTVLIWSKYERTQLKNLLNWLQDGREDNAPGLAEWVSRLIDSCNGILTPGTAKMVDQHDLVVKYWFHPLMQNRTSLKVALPSALESAPSGRIDQWLTDHGFVDNETETRPSNPYRLLPSLRIPGLADEQSDEDKIISIDDGVEAMYAYRDMLYGRFMNRPDQHEGIQDALRRYCQLDTLAQVIVWEHWRMKVGL